MTRSYCASSTRSRNCASRAARSANATSSSASTRRGDGKQRRDDYIYLPGGVEMDKTVDVTIPVDPGAAAALGDARNREAVGRLISRVLRPAAGPTPLTQAIAEMKAEARATGLTDADIDAELAAYNAERRGRSHKS